MIVTHIDPPDGHYYLAAIGWLELGNPREALHELDQISEVSSKDPDILELRWKIYAELKEWHKALEVARTLIDVAPERPSGWINRSYCLHEMKETKQAFILLYHAAEKFPSEPIVAYNLACYSCQLDNLEESRKWLKIAMEVAKNKDEIKEMALSDPDLQPLWDEIRNM